MTTATMEAVVYRAGGRGGCERRPRPSLNEATDAVVRVTTSTICPTDLRIARGGLSGVAEGRILGHEGVGVVEEVGAAVERFRGGDRVLISCVTSCGRCAPCRRTLFTRCEDGGQILGRRIDGTQAAYVRVPHADGSLYTVPEGSDEEALVMLSDVLPTSLECGVFKGRVKPGDRIAVLGSGPAAAAAVLIARLYAPSEILLLWADGPRPAETYGRPVRMVDNSGGDAAERVIEMTRGSGVDMAVMAEGGASAMELCGDIVAPGGHIADLGTRPEPGIRHSREFLERGVTLSRHRIGAGTLAVLLKMLQIACRRGGDSAQRLRFPLAEAGGAYEAFGRPGAGPAPKVILTGPPTAGPAAPARGAAVRAPAAHGAGPRPAGRDRIPGEPAAWMGLQGPA